MDEQQIQQADTSDYINHLVVTEYLNEYNSGARSLVELEFQQKAKALIDSLKSICANYGLGNDGNEFKIITQAFLYKFNDKFAYEAKRIQTYLGCRSRWGTMAKMPKRTGNAATADGR